MQLQPSDIEVGCILRPRLDLNAPSHRGKYPLLNTTFPGIPCQRNTLFDRRRKVNINRDCSKGCVLNPQGQEHPVVVIQIKEDKVSYVQMTSNRVKRDWRSQFSPIGHYFPVEIKEEKWIPHRLEMEKDKIIPHPKNYRSRYWLKVDNFSKTTIDEDRAKRTSERTIELQKYSELRLPHVFTQPLSNFEAFGGDNSKATQHSLDKASYYRLMDRLGIRSGTEKEKLLSFLRQNHKELAPPSQDHVDVCDSPNNTQPPSQVDPLSGFGDKNSRSTRKLSRLVSLKVRNWLHRRRTI